LNYPVTSQSNSPENISASFIYQFKKTMNTNPTVLCHTQFRRMRLNTYHQKNHNLMNNHKYTSSATYSS